MKNNEINEGLMDLCIEKLEALCVGEEKTEFTLCNDISSHNCIQITSIELNFYQLWCLFGTEPRVFLNGKTGYLSGLNLYEYNCLSKKGDVFCIYAWGNKLLDLSGKWMIASNCKDQVEIQNFLEYLFDALKCYSKYYRSIEHGVFDSDIPVVNVRMKTIQQELFERMCTLDNM